MFKIRPVLALLAGLAAAQQTPNLEGMMRSSEAAWNRGDLESFVIDYDDSPETTFIGRTVTRGSRKAILDRYRRGYPTRAAMGTLTYSEMVIRMVSPELAIMTGRFELKRAQNAGGDSTGRFTLIWKRTPEGWKIIHDHSS
jgi:ketosteroid isomerase-like protein